MEKAIDQMAERALRTICIAYKDVPTIEGVEFKTKDDKGVFLVE